MPLTNDGKLILRKFKRDYGEENGEDYFFGWLSEKSKKERKKYEHTERKKR